MLWSTFNSDRKGTSILSRRFVDSFSMERTLPNASTMPVNIHFLFAPDQMDVTVQLPVFDTIKSAEMNNAGIIINTIRTFSLAEFVLSIPVDVLICGFKNKI